MNVALGPRIGPGTDLKQRSPYQMSSAHNGRAPRAAGLPSQQDTSPQTSPLTPRVIQPTSLPKSPPESPQTSKPVLLSLHPVSWSESLSFALILGPAAYRMTTTRPEPAAPITCHAPVDVNPRHSIFRPRAS